MSDRVVVGSEYLDIINIESVMLSFYFCQVREDIMDLGEDFTKNNVEYDDDGLPFLQAYVSSRYSFRHVNATLKTNRRKHHVVQIITPCPFF